MSLHRRGKVWWVRFTAPNGKRVRQSTGTTNRLKAQEYYYNLRNEYWRIQKLGEKPRHTWMAAVEKWLQETQHKVSIGNDISRLKWLSPYLHNKYLDEITRDHVDYITQQRLLDGVKNSTVNKTIQTIRVILRKAEREWGWIDKAPTFRTLTEPKERIRWLTKEDANRLIEELPTHLAEMVRFSLSTGLRESNVTGLEWSQVDIERKIAWIHADQAKAGKAIQVPLNKDTIRVLRRQQGKHERFVFTYKGKPVTKAGGKAWRKALDRAGLRKYDGAESKTKYSPYPCHEKYKFEDFRWHDLRHTWASWHIQGGTPLYDLQLLGGWSDISIVQRYAHQSAKHLAEYANKLSLPEVIDTNLAQSTV